MVKLLKYCFLFRAQTYKSSCLSCHRYNSSQVEPTSNYSFEFHDYYDQKIFELFLNHYFVESSINACNVGILGKELMNNLQTEWQRCMLNDHINAIKIPHTNKRFIVFIIIKTMLLLFS